MSVLHLSLRAATRLWEAAIVLVVGVYFVLVIGLLGLRYLVLPNADQFRPWVEQAASRAIGLPLHIGAIQTSWTGLMPQFTFRDVQVDQPDGQPALRFAQVEAAPSWASLPRLEPDFDSIVIRGANLTVTRPDADHLEVGGLRFALDGGSGDAARPFADWLVKQGRIEVFDSRLTWVNAADGAAPLELSNVNIVLRNGLLRHRAALQATPPASFSGPIDLRADFRQPLLMRHPSDLSQWRGTLYGLLPDASLTAVQQQLPVRNPWPASQGRGSLRVWAKIDQGVTDDLTADLALRDVAIQARPDAAPLMLSTLTGRLAWTRLPHGQRLAATGLSLRTAGGRVLPAIDASWQQQQPPGKAHSASLRVGTLDLGAAARLAATLPLPAPWPARLLAMQPQGMMHKLDATWSWPAGADKGTMPPIYAVKASFDHLGWNSPGTPTDMAKGAPSEPRWTAAVAAAAKALALPADIPGLRDASGNIDATQDGGMLFMSLAKGGGLDLPRLYDPPQLTFDHLQLDLRWTRERDGLLRVQTRNLTFANADAAGSASVVWQQAAKGLGQLTLRGDFTRADARAVWRYLPLGIPLHTRDYLRSAIASGNAQHVQFEAEGPVAQFPYDRPGDKGHFKVQAQIENGVFNYAPRQMLPSGRVAKSEDAGANSDWPVFRDVAGQITVTGSSLEVKDASAQALGATLRHVDARLPSFRDGVLQVNGQASADASDALHILTASPIDKQLGNPFTAAQASGPVQLDLSLRLPLDHLDDTTVSGTATLNKVAVQWRPDLPRVTGVGGTVHFTDGGFDLDLHAPQVLGGAFRLSGGQQPNQPLRLIAQGQVDAAVLRTAPGIPDWLRSLGGMLAGRTGYTLAVDHPKGVATASYVLRSGMNGMAIDLPPPIGKPADAGDPVVFSSTPTADGGLTMRIDLGNGDLRAAYAFGPAAANGSRPVLNGGIALGPQAILPAPMRGVQANVRLPVLDVDAWNAAIDKLRPAGAGQDGGDLDRLLPTTLSLDIGRLTLLHRVVDDVVVGATRMGDAWQASVNARQLSGYVSWRSGSGGNPGAVTARLARLTLPRSSDSDVEQLLDDQPSAIPALDITADNVDLHGHHFDRLEVTAVNRGSGANKSWQLTHFTLRSPAAVLTGSGSWSAAAQQLSAPGAAAGPARRASMRFDLSIGDAGGLLATFGKPGLLKGGKGSIKGDLAWFGSPLSLDFPTLDGHFTLALGRGQFLKADPGFAKLLGILSLQAIPRRFTLDFRDLFSSGFAFDQVDANVKVNSGVASTDDFRMRGVSASVRISGKADLAKETQDLRVVVVPDVNAGAASLAYALINPVIGIGTFLAQLVAREPLARAFTHVYDITGTWVSPNVTEVPLAEAPVKGASAPAGP